MAHSGRQNSFAIRDIRIFDGRAVLDKATVVVREGRIVSVGGNTDLPAGVAVIDGSGKTLLPGLINSHVHSVSADQLREQLVFGVTTVLNMYADPAAVTRTRQAQAQGQAGETADLFSSGNMAIAPGSGANRELAAPAIAGPDEAEAFVDARLREGSDYIKIIYGNVGTGDPVISEATLRAVVTAARRRGKLSVVHIDNAAAALTAVNAGVDGLAHLYVSGEPAEDSLVEAVRKNGTFVIPTLTVLETLTGVRGTATLLADPAVAAFLTDRAGANLQAPLRPNPKLNLLYTQQLVASLSKSGAAILAGTDEPMPGTWHGVSLHRELELLRESGLSPVQVLASATSVPAERFRLQDRGRIAPGYRADMLLVEGDPTTDIRASRKIVSVWKAGLEMDRDAFRREIQAAKNRSSIEVDPAILASYSGRYDFGQELVITVSSKVNRLRIELPNGRSISLDAASEREFFSKEIGAELRFEKSAAGEPDVLVIKQGDEERRGKRIE